MRTVKMNKFDWVVDTVLNHELKCTAKQFDETLKTYELADNGYIYISGFDAVNIAQQNGKPVASRLEDGSYRLISDGSRSALIDLRRVVK